MALSVSSCRCLESFVGDGCSMYSGSCWGTTEGAHHHHTEAATLQHSLSDKICSSFNGHFRLAPKHISLQLTALKTYWQPIYPFIPTVEGGTFVWALLMLGQSVYFDINPQTLFLLLASCNNTFMLQQANNNASMSTESACVCVCVIYTCTTNRNTEWQGEAYVVHMKIVTSRSRTQRPPQHKHWATHST